MGRSLLLSFLVTGALALQAQAQAPANTTTQMSSELGKIHVEHTSKLTARVVEIDRADRVVTLKGPKGNTVDIVCGEEVRNFDQIKLGDQVTAQFVASAVIELKKTEGSVRQLTEKDRAARANPGESPAGMAAREVVVLANIIGVDAAKKAVTLKGPKGNVYTVEVKDPEQFKLVKVGDQVEATYTMAVAVSVEPTPVLK
jgi:hypothetical protein